MPVIRMNEHRFDTDDVLRVGDFVSRDKLTYLQVFLKDGSIIELRVASGSHNPSPADRAARIKKGQAVKDRLSRILAREQRA